METNRVGCFSRGTWIYNIAYLIFVEAFPTFLLPPTARSDSLDSLPIFSFIVEVEEKDIYLRNR